VRRWLRPQVAFSRDDEAPFHPLPASQAYAMLEWGLNWCISDSCNSYLIVHAGVVARDGRALVLCGEPGAGKSTLCAALVARGWRLMSDELTLFDPHSGLISALARPIGLKNESINIIRSFAADFVVGPTVAETSKGSVAHVKPPTDSVVQAREPAAPTWIVFPRYSAGEAACLKPVSKAVAFMKLAENAFNYDLHGREGFDFLATTVDRCGCFEFGYSKLEDACAIFDGIAGGAKQ
jgi:HprK-related kinase A